MANSTIDAASTWADPLVLQWAREQAAYEPGQVEGELQISPGTVRAWERGLGHPDVEMLRRLSRLYDVPFSYFFLETPPEEPRFTDYRGVPQERRKKLSRDTQLALREFRRLSGLAMTLQEITGKTTRPEVSRADSSEIPEQVARREAKRLSIGPDLRKRWRSKEDAYQARREILERLGIFVFSSRMPASECRGAAISERSYATAIFVNQNEAPTARSFTLFHEYCHLMLTAGTQLVLCDHFPGYTESFSNRFASSILLPEDEFAETLDARGLYRYYENWPDVTLLDLATDFFVSKDVIAIRLENLTLAPSGFYQRKRERWDEVFRVTSGFGRGGKGKKAYAEEKLGPTLLNLTLSAVRSGVLHPADAALCIGEVRGGTRPWLVKVKDMKGWTQEQGRI